MYKMLRRGERQRDWSQRENEEGMRVWLNIQLSTIEIQKKKRRKEWYSIHNVNYAEWIEWIAIYA